MFGGGSYWGELSAAPIDASYHESVTAVAFDGLQEVVWAGSIGGRELTFQSPSLELCAFWPAHTHPVVSLSPLPGSDLCLSVAADSALLANAGGVRRSGYLDQECGLLCGCLEPAAVARGALLGTAAGHLLTMDLASGRTTVAVREVFPGEGVAALRPGLARGQVVLATSTGRLAMVDPRGGYKVEAGGAVIAHSAGVAALDVRDGHVAVCGYKLRAGVLTRDPYVKVFDVRGSLLRPLLTLPFAGPGGPPACLAFHPQLPSLLLVGCGRGALCLADTGAGSTVAMYQAETAGAALTSCAVSSSGEAWALGDELGCVRLWAESHEPHVHLAGLPWQAPTPSAQPPLVRLSEQDGFALAHKPPLDAAAGPRLLSDVEATASMLVGLAPRVIDPSLLSSIKQVDFVGHLANPYYVRGEPYGVATAKVATLRNKRVDMKLPSRGRAEAAAARAERAKRRAAEGGVLLPTRFHRVELRAQSGLKFEDSDTSFYNRTRFGGLENDLPNAYANPLLQVLYFSPELRAGLLGAHVPEPDVEFCLTCELGLLFRMIMGAAGTAVQAANLLRALRQMREAAALGLLDVGAGGNAASGAAEAAHDVTGLREWALGRRCAALSRFLLETLVKEANAAAKPPLPVSPAVHRSGIAQPAPVNAKMAALLEQLFAMPTRQTLQCLSGMADGEGRRPSRTRDSRILQVDLLYAQPGKRTGGRTASEPGRPPLARQSSAATSVLSLGAGGSGDGVALCVSPKTPSTPPNGGGGWSSLQPMAEPFTPPHGTPLNGSGVLSPTTPAAGAGLLSPVHPSVPTDPLWLSSATFADLLQETRAWFDDVRGYAMIRSSRVPLALPQILAVGCAVAEASDVAWWTGPHPAGPGANNGGAAHVAQAHRLPWAVRIEVNPATSDVRVRQGSSAALLLSLPGSFVADNGHEVGSASPPGALPQPQPQPQPPAGVLDAVYELVAVVAHVRDVDEEPLHDGGAPRTPGPGDISARAAAARPSQNAHPYDGHLVAMVKVPRSYWDEAAIPSACVSPPIGSGTPAAPPPLGIPTRASASQVTDVRPHDAAVILPELDELLSHMGISSARGSGSGTGRGATSTGGAPLAAPFHEGAISSSGGALPRDSSNGAATEPAGGVAHPAVGGVPDDDGAGLQQGWLLLNDFAVSPLLPDEVLDVYGGQKLPCLLHFRRVDAAAISGEEEGGGSAQADSSTSSGPLPPPAVCPVLTAAEFAQLCRAPPLQGRQVQIPPRFQPLDMASEPPRPGMLLALDAEFVMVSAPERMLDSNLEVLTRQSRLTLGRVSVVRGEGPAAGTPCIDDYVRAVEPVLDHLTRYSGLVPGDLDPTTSTHHLTTMKHAYLKLRYLVDVGCVFVGHGLAKDLRIINITVPPQQIVDTVELFSRWRQRKMSLRFLASYLLGTHIQAAVHDSVEDARTALRLYETYTHLVAAGTFQAKLDELYSWGARHGWEPVSLDANGQPMPPTPSPAAAITPTAPLGSLSLS